METSIVRIAKRGEEAAMHAAHMRSIREVCIKDHGPDEVKGWGNRPLGERWVVPIAEENAWVVEVDGVIQGVGCIRVLKEATPRRAHLLCLYLTPEVLGRGCGSKLAKVMLDKAREMGAAVIGLESTLTAHKFYLKLGFQDTGPIQKQDIGGYPVRYIPMEMHLG